MASKKAISQSASKSNTKSSRLATKRKYVIVRTYSAGVHVGELVKRIGREVELASARRIWSWKGANTLHEISLRGVGAGSRVSEAVETITLLEAIEILPCTEIAEKNLRAAAWSP